MSMDTRPMPFPNHAGRLQAYIISADSYLRAGLVESAARTLTLAVAEIEDRDAAVNAWFAAGSNPVNQHTGD